MQVIKKIIKGLLLIWGALFTLAGISSIMNKTSDIGLMIFIIIIFGIIPIYLSRRLFRTKIKNEKTKKELTDHNFSNKKNKSLSEPTEVLEKIDDPEEFLNNISSRLGSIRNLGTFCDSITVAESDSFFINGTTTEISRIRKKGETPGKRFTRDGIDQELFEFPYNTPEKITDKEYTNLIGSTIIDQECSPVERCQDCRGTGDCPECQGSGKKICRNCDGSGKIEVADGRYKDGRTKYKKIGCRDCNGSGKQYCGRCDGRKDCDVCNGKGVVTCERCEGTGVFQTFDYYVTEFMNKTFELGYSPEAEIEEFLDDANGEDVFQGNLISWSNEKDVIEDKTTELSEKYPPLKILFKKYLDTYDKSEKKRPAIIKTSIRKIPTWRFMYDFESKPYSLIVYGKNGKLFAKEVPQSHFYTSGGVANRIRFRLKETKFRIAYALIAGIIFNADDVVEEEEKEFLQKWCDRISIPEMKKKALFERALGSKYDGNFPKELSVLKKNKKALVFAWQCTIHDKNITQQEIDVFDKLADFLKVEIKNVELLRTKASKLTKFDISELVTEYFGE